MTDLPRKNRTGQRRADSPRNTATNHTRTSRTCHHRTTITEPRRVP